MRSRHAEARRFRRAPVLATTSRTSRRISAGITPAPGVTARLPAWWSADDWAEAEVREAVDDARQLCREHHVEPDTVIAVARAMAHFGDYRTGRGCRPTNNRLSRVGRVSVATIQRARRVLKALGLVVEVTAGRSIMTRAERLTAWRRGSSHRHVAAEFVLCSRRQRKLRPQGHTAHVDRDAPPVSIRNKRSSQDQSTSLQSTAETRRGAPRPAPTKKGLGRRPRAPDPATRRLAEGIRGRLRWLSGVSVRRLAPPLHRFAQAGWTPRDVDRAVTDALATRGWRLPRELKQPAAYLATLLRSLDPDDRPSLLDEWIAQREAVQRAYERQLVVGTPCRHGQPAGDVPSPLRGIGACPLCRAATDRVGGKE
jgi:hypothetical protein